MNRYQRIIDLNSLNNSAQVLDELIYTNTLLKGTNLQQLAPFNSVYITMTKNLRKAIKANLFQEKSTIEQLIINFACLYFSVLNASAEDKHLPKAWLTTINARSQFFPYLVLLGANAHINYDLPVALRKTLAGPGKFEADFLLINTIVAKTVDDTLQDHKAGSVIEKLIIKTRSLCAKPVTHELIRWRTKVWSRYAVY